MLNSKYDDIDNKFSAFFYQKEEHNSLMFDNLIDADMLFKENLACTISDDKETICLSVLTEDEDLPVFTATACLYDGEVDYQETAGDESLLSWDSDKKEYHFYIRLNELVLKHCKDCGGHSDD